MLLNKTDVKGIVVGGEYHTIGILQGLSHLVRHLFVNN